MRLVRIEDPADPLWLKLRQAPGERRADAHSVKRAERFISSIWDTDAVCICGD
jgi:hypothetical protein